MILEWALPNMNWSELYWTVLCPVLNWSEQWSLLTVVPNAEQNWTVLKADCGARCWTLLNTTEHCWHSLRRISCGELRPKMFFLFVSIDVFRLNFLNVWWSSHKIWNNKKNISLQVRSQFSLAVLIASQLRNYFLDFVSKKIRK